VTEIWRVIVPTLAKNKMFPKSRLNGKKLGMVVIPAKTGGINRRIKVQSSLGKNETLSSKYPEQKGMGSWLKQ
jgi:hypothetical protein